MINCLDIELQLRVT